MASAPQFGKRQPGTFQPPTRTPFDLFGSWTGLGEQHAFPFPMFPPGVEKRPSLTKCGKRPSPAQQHHPEAVPQPWGGKALQGGGCEDSEGGVQR